MSGEYKRAREGLQQTIVAHKTKGQKNENEPNFFFQQQF